MSEDKRSACKEGESREQIDRQTENEIERGLYGACATCTVYTLEHPLLRYAIVFRSMCEQ